MTKIQGKSITWAQKCYDLAWDEEPVPVEQATGNKGLGGIIAGMFAFPMIMIISATIRQMVTGTATGSPVGSIIAAILGFGLPVWWGILQFFRRRRFYLDNGVIYFEFISLFKRKKAEVSTVEYKEIVFGQTGGAASTSQSDFGGSTGYYYVGIRHSNPQMNIDFYREISEPMPKERIQRYSEILGLPIAET